MRVKLSGLSQGITSLIKMTKELHLEEAKPKLEATAEEVKASRLSPERIRGLRKKLGISMRQLGILTGTSLSAILSWEKGTFRPKEEKKAVLVALRKVKKLLAEKAEESRKGKAGKEPARRNFSRKKVAQKGKAAAKRPKPRAKRTKKG